MYTHTNNIVKSIHSLFLFKSKHLIIKVQVA